jgi:hypothetical protein
VVLVEYFSNLYFHIRRRNATKAYKSPEKPLAAKEEGGDMQMEK